MSTSTKKRTVCANQLLRPYSTSQIATPMPIGMAITDASATISIVPRIALWIPPIEELLKNVLPVGSVVKKLALHEPRPLLQQVEDDQRERDQREDRGGEDRRRARGGRGACARGARRKAGEALVAHRPGRPRRSAREAAAVGRPQRAARRSRRAPRAARSGARSRSRRSVSTNRTSPAANSAERCRPCASPNSLAITAARL